MKHIKLVVCLFPFYLLAQTEAAKPATPGQPTKEAAEAALRERVKNFYDLQIDGKFRQTETFVCPESQEAYYGLPKSKPFSAEIASVDFTEDLKAATVSARLEQNQTFGGIEQRVKLPRISHWKLAEAQWCYYLLPPSSTADTPFGKMDFSGGKGKASASDSSSAAPEIKPQMAPPDAKLVGFSKTALNLPFDADGSDELVVSNALPGPVVLQVVCPIAPGLACTVDQATLTAGARVKLHVDFKFTDTPLKAGLAVQVWIQPFGRAVTIPIAKLEATKPQ